MHKCFVFQNSLTLLLEGEATCSVLKNQRNSYECKAKHDWIIMWLYKSLNLQKKHQNMQLKIYTRVSPHTQQSSARCGMSEQIASYM